MMLRLIFFAMMLTGLHAQGQHPVTLDIRHMPMPVMISGKSVIYYELWVTSAVSRPLTLQSLEVISARDSSVVAVFTENDLKRRYAIPEARVQAVVLPPGGSGLLYLEVTLPASDTYPSLAHRLKLTDGDQKTSFIRGGIISFPEQFPPVLGQPLRGGPWVAIYEPAWERGHRWVLYTVNDTTRLPGRFAIDFMLLNQQARMTHHNADSIVNWYGYAADVLAVASGEVVAIRNDFPESPTLSAHPTHPPEKAAGNYVVLDIGHGRYVFYEHLKPGSVIVKVGQHVRKGQQIAALGFTGHTTGPHLHLHVANRNSSLGAEGLPFSLEKFNLLGSYPGAEGLGEKPWVPADGKQLFGSRQRPAPNAVISFPK